MHAVGQSKAAAATADVAEAERRAQLAHMTTAEALAIWRDLASSLNRRPELHENLDRLDLWQVEGLLTTRRARSSGGVSSAIMNLQEAAA
jgi:hypothetical protein